MASATSQPKPAFDVIEEAVRVLRSAPGRVPAFYFLGTLPFVAGALYFWTDMAHETFAHMRLGRSSLGIALLFIWMKHWQHLSSRVLRAHIERRVPAPLGLAALARRCANQALLHATGLILLPLAAFVVAPFGWLYAFYQSTTAASDNDADDLRSLVRASAQHANHWKKQNHVIVWILCPHLLLLVCTFFFALLPFMEAVSPVGSRQIVAMYSIVLAVILAPLSPFALVVAINIGSALLLLPMLLRIFTGIETAFSINTEAALSPTFFLIVCGLTYLCLDPIVKAAYTLRAHYGESLHTGADIRLAIQRLRIAPALLVLGGTVLGGAMAFGQEPTTLPTTVRSLDPERLSAAIDQVLEQRVYAWRLPPGKIERGDTWLGENVRDMLNTVGEWADDAWAWIRDGLRALRDALLPNALLPTGRYPAVGKVLTYGLYGLIGVLVFAVAYMLIRSWRIRPLRLDAFAVKSAPDVKDESTTAEELPEDGWLRLARDLRDKGEYRGSIRALFFAALARLAAAELIRVARHKSNREYDAELRTRAHVDRGLSERYLAAMNTYETVWYGFHEASPELVQSFQRQQDEVRVRAE